MRTLLKLLFAQIRHRPARTALTSCAVIASSCLVVWVVSGYDALLSESIDDNAAKAIGRFNLVLSTNRWPGGPSTKASTGAPRPSRKDASSKGKLASPAEKGITKKEARRGGSRPGPGGSDAEPITIPAQLIDDLKRDPRILEVNQTSQSRVGVAKVLDDSNVEPIDRLLRDDRPPVHGMPPLTPPLIGTDAGLPPYEIQSGRWIAMATDQQGKLPEAVLSAGYTRRLKVEPGATLRIVSEVGEWKVNLVGIVDQPNVAEGRGSGPGVQAGLFVSLPFAETVNGYSTRPNRVNLVLREDANASEVRSDLAGQLEKLGPSITITDLNALKESLAQGLSQSGNRTLAYSATAIALMAALFIIFTTLGMGVSERARELAVLRAVGLTRLQVASLVFLEGLALGVLGWAGGLVAGKGLLFLMERARPELFVDAGGTLGTWCVALTAIAAIGGAIGASALPAWRATRIAPLDAMAPTPEAPTRRWLIPVTLAGVALASINPLLTYFLPISDSTRVWSYALIGYPAMVLGFVLLTPLVILAVEHLAAPWMARGLGLPTRLLVSLLSANLWRTLGTAISLTVGLGLFIATQTWGYSMLAPYTPGDWVPEMLVGFEPSGLPDSGMDRVRHVKGVIPERCMPLAVEQPRVVKSQNDRVNIGVTRHDNVVLIGLDPQLAFSGTDPMISARFTDGDRANAVEKLKTGKACVVLDHLLESMGLKLGDALELIPPRAPGNQPVRYEIVGAVSLPGWPWITKMTGLRRQTTRTGALIFAPLADVQRDFQVRRINFFWLDTDGTTTAPQVESAMQAIAEAHGESEFQVAGVGTVASQRPYARLTSTEAVREGIQQRADDMIWGMTQIPLITLLITSLAVVNTILSSVRARRWEMGILRALGTTRSGLVRLVLAESLLIALAVSVLSFGFGVMAGWCGTGMARYLSPFGGLNPPLVLPWWHLILGIGSAWILCLVAAMGPALSVGRAEPLKLLQAGRAAG